MTETRDSSAFCLRLHRGPTTTRRRAPSRPRRRVRCSLLQQTGRLAQHAPLARLIVTLLRSFPAKLGSFSILLRLTSIEHPDPSFAHPLATYTAARATDRWPSIPGPSFQSSFSQLFVVVSFQYARPPGPDTAASTCASSRDECAWTPRGACCPAPPTRPETCLGSFRHGGLGLSRERGSNNLHNRRGDSDCNFCPPCINLCREQAHSPEPTDENH